jgi:hypothetical protein
MLRKTEVSFSEGTARLDKLRINESHKCSRDFLWGYRRYDPEHCDIRIGALLPQVCSHDSLQLLLIVL